MYSKKEIKNMEKLKKLLDICKMQLYNNLACVRMHADNTTGGEKNANI